MKRRVLKNTMYGITSPQFKKSMIELGFLPPDIKQVKFTKQKAAPKIELGIIS